VSTTEVKTPRHMAEQEVARLDRMVNNREARLADAKRKLAAAKTRLKAVKS
jgi:hypothetical protein